jgi:outer membrane protein assembly factor BamB
MMKKTLLFLFILLPTIPSQGQIATWRGENRDGHFNEENLLKAWPEAGPELIMTVQGIGNGWSSAIAANNTIYVTGKKDSMDYLSAISLNGDIKWQTPYGLSWDKSYPQSRGSVTVEGNRVYVISGRGVLSCINGDTGKENWSVDVDAKFEARVSPFGASETPLIIDDKVICTPCGGKAAVVAFNKMNGQLLWQSENVEGDKIFSSPIIYAYKNFRYILAGTSTHLIALIPETGEIAWSYRHYLPGRERSQPGDGQYLINNPIFKDDEIFISRGYNYPAIMIKMDSTGRSVKEKWINQTLDNEHGGVIRIDDHIYGANYNNPQMGKWVCLEWNSGEVTYLQEWINKGSIIAADGMLYIYEERKGNIGMVNPDPDKFDLISSFKIEKGTGPHWAHLSIFDGIMYVRRGDVLMCYLIKEVE